MSNHTNHPLQPAIAALLRETHRAHHHAFTETGGYDPQWPAWYADHLDRRLSTLLKTSVNAAELAAHLTAFDHEYRTQSPEAPWDDHYAGRIIETYLNSY